MNIRQEEYNKDPNFQARKLIERSFYSIKKAPLMWGPPIAIELQFLQLLEFYVALIFPSIDKEKPMFVQERYITFIMKCYPGVGCSPLAEILKDQKDPTATVLTDKLFEFKSIIEKELK